MVCVRFWGNNSSYDQCVFYTFFVQISFYTLSILNPKPNIPCSSTYILISTNITAGKALFPIALL